MTDELTELEWSRMQRSRVAEYSKRLGKAMLLPMLCSIVEYPGHNKKFYSSGSNERSCFEAINALIEQRLIVTDKNEGEYTLTPTAEGESIYIGIWYAAHSARGLKYLISQRHNAPYDLPDPLWPKNTPYRFIKTEDKPNPLSLVDCTGREITPVYDCEMLDIDRICISRGPQGFHSISYMNTEKLDLDDELTKKIVRESLLATRQAIIDAAAGQIDDFLHDLE